MAERLKLVPYPEKAEIFAGTLVCDALRICGKEEINGLKLADLFSDHSINVSPRGVALDLSCDGSGDDEGYFLEISEEGIKATAKSDRGLFYAVVTLVQLIRNYKGKLPRCRMSDRPKTSYRGFMLDTGRYFFKKEDVLRLVDLCVLHKINVLHLHLTEDQGWRIEIDKYPLLAQKGSVRSHTNFGFKPHGGYYTKEDIKEMISYCNARNIEVIPEFDIPGHSQAAIACYPWLGCFGRQLEVATHSGVKHDILCAGKESTYRFVFDVIDELIGLFGKNTRYIHLGGDEAVKTRWKICPDCQAAMKKLGLKTEDELQAHFMKRVAEYVVSKGYIPIMWNETDLSLPCHDNMVWQLWTTADGAVTTEEIVGAACARGGLINSDSGYAYLDLPYADISLEKSYEFASVPKGTDKGKSVGAEAALWSEYVPDFKTACKRTLPRLSALAEKMWTGEGDFSEFKTRLEIFSEFLSDLGYKGASERQASPGKVRAFFQKIWFERRQLHWQGLHNLIDNAAVKRKYAAKGDKKC